MGKFGLLNSSALVSALAIGLSAGATPAFAQTPAPTVPGGDACQAPADQRDSSANCPPADSPADEAIAQGETVTASDDQGVVVVGSRIRRDRFSGADPVTVINRDAAVDAGFNSTAEILQSVGVTGGNAQINDTYGGLVVSGGPGVNTLGLRGLGANRTLILLNGRRVAPAGTRGQVAAADLNVLPTTIVDRIEVLNTGASSIYGSDAVAGVVNITTLSKFNGLAVEADVTAPQIGAGTSQRYAITAGTSGERFSVLGSLEVFDRNRITQGDQPWARCPQQRRLMPLGANDTDKCFPLEEGGVTINAIATNRHFGSWSGGNPRSVAPEKAARTPLKGSVIVVDMPGSGQAAVVVARTGVSRADPLYYPALVANAVLGGGYSARLNQEIRIKRGLSYGSGSSLDARRRAGPFLAVTQTRNDAAGQVLDLALGEMAKLGAEPISAAELSARRSSLTGSFGRTVETTSGTANLIASYIQRGVSPDTLDTYLPSVLKVSPDAIQEVASDLLKAEGSTVVIVGDAAQFADKLRKGHPDLVLIPLKELDLNSPSLRKPRPRE